MEEILAILSIQFMNYVGSGGEDYLTSLDQLRKNHIESLKIKVNEVLKNNPNAQVTWLQSSGASKHGSFTQLTAIVSQRK